MNSTRLFASLSLIIGILALIIGFAISDLLIAISIIWIIIGIIFFFYKGIDNSRINISKIDKELKSLQEEAIRADKAAERLSKIKYK